MEVYLTVPACGPFFEMILGDTDEERKKKVQRGRYDRKQCNFDFLAYGGSRGENRSGSGRHGRLS